MISVTKNQERIFSSVVLSRLCSNEKFQDEYLDEIFCDYPDISEKFSFSDLSLRSKRDKPVILSYPKKMTIYEALKADKLKYYTLSWEQERNIALAIRDELYYEKFFCRRSSTRPHKKVLSKWEDIDKPIDFYEFSFLCKWFKKINLESRVNNYIFVRIAGGEYIERVVFNKKWSHKIEDTLSLYIDDESPIKIELTKKFQKELLELMYYHPTLDLHRSLRFRYCIFSEMYHTYSSFNTNTNIHQSAYPMKRYHKASAAANNFFDRQFIYTENGNDIDYNKRNSMRSYYLAKLLTVPAPNTSVMYSYAYRPYPEELDMVEDLRMQIQNNTNFDLCLPYIKNVPFEIWYAYYVFSRYMYSHITYSSYDLMCFDRWQIDTAIKWVYAKISYKFFGSGSIPKKFYEEFGSFGDAVVKRMNENGHVFYDEFYAKNYINNMIKLVLPAFVIARNCNVESEKNPSMLQVHNRCVSYATKDGCITPILDGDYNSKCTNSLGHMYDVYSFGGKYNITTEDFNDSDIISKLQDVMSYFGSTVDKTVVVKSFLYEGLFPVFDKSRLSVVDLYTGEEVHCIMDLSKGVM